MSMRPKYDHARIIRLWRRGIRKDVIAERIGCTRRTVNRVIRANVKQREGLKEENA